MHNNKPDPYVKPPCRSRYGVDHGVDDTYSPGDCILKSGTDSDGCPEHNLDLYVRSAGGGYGACYTPGYVIADSTCDGTSEDCSTEVGRLVGWPRLRRRRRVVHAKPNSTVSRPHIYLTSTSHGASLGNNMRCHNQVTCDTASYYSGDAVVSCPVEGSNFKLDGCGRGGVILNEGTAASLCVVVAVVLFCS